MKEIGILMQTPMVQAILAKRKTETRRLKGLENINAVGNYELHGSNSGETGMVYNIPNPEDLSACFKQVFTDIIKYVKAPYQPGDVLWVREEHYMYGHWEPDNTRKRKTSRQAWKFVPDSNDIRYSDNPPEFVLKGKHPKHPEISAWHKRLARFMPKSAARIWMKVLYVYPERVQDITEESAKNEGAHMCHFENDSIYSLKEYTYNDRLLFHPTYKTGFKLLWASINGEESWNRNDWVWVIKFEQIDCPCQ